jgi:hypothetical protein
MGCKRVPSGHTEKYPQRWTLRITLLARDLSFVSSPRQGARRRRLVRVGMTLYHEAYVTSEAVPKPDLAVPERD